jgi:hypothetical protein
MYESISSISFCNLKSAIMQHISSGFGFAILGSLQLKRSFKSH